VEPKTRLIDRTSWEDIAPEYRKRWQDRREEDPSTWDTYEPWYRYGYESAFDPRFEGKGWVDVEADLRTKHPEWAEKHGHRYHEKEGLWDRFKDSVKEAWESATGRN